MNKVIYKCSKCIIWVLPNYQLFIALGKVLHIKYRDIILIEKCTPYKPFTVTVVSIVKKTLFFEIFMSPSLIKILLQ